jgi:hypothetical protein
MRVFKTKWFSKAAKSHAIKDSELCQAIEAVVQGRLTTSAGSLQETAEPESRSRHYCGERWGALVLHVPLCQTGYGKH